MTWRGLGSVTSWRRDRQIVKLILHMLGILKRPFQQKPHSQPKQVTDASSCFFFLPPCPGAPCLWPDATRGAAAGRPDIEFPRGACRLFGLGTGKDGGNVERRRQSV